VGLPNAIALTVDVIASKIFKKVHQEFTMIQFLIYALLAALLAGPFIG
jgi:hypothetical protein